MKIFIKVVYLVLSIIIVSCSDTQFHSITNSTENDSVVVKSVDECEKMKRMVAERDKTPEGIQLKKDIKVFLQYVTVNQETQEMSLSLTQEEAEKKGISKENYELILADYNQAAQALKEMTKKDN